MKTKGPREPIHFSLLKHIGQSPMHMAYFAENEREDTDTFLKGRAFHALVLQGIIPTYWSGRRAGNEYKEAVELNGGVELLTETMFREVMAMGNAVAGSRLAQGILRRCPNRETYIEWERDGVQCAGTVDAHGDNIIAELKSTECAHPYRFKRSAHWYRYPEQMAWYDVGLGTVVNKDEPELTKFSECYIIACESKAPWPVSVLRVTPLRLVQADATCSDWLEKYKQCRRMNYWPGWDEFIEDIGVDINIDPEEEN